VSLDLWRGSDLAFSRSLASNSLNGTLTHQIQKELLAARERFGVEQTFYCGVLAQRDLGAIPFLEPLSTRGLLTNRVPPVSHPYVLPACGAALRGLGRGSTDINLLPEALRIESARLVTTATYILLAVLAVTTLGFGGSLLFQQYKYARNLETKLQSIAPKIEEVKKLQQEGDALEKVIKLLRGGEMESPKKIAILRELTQIIPKEAYITELRVDDEKIELVGFAKSATELISTLESSPFFRAPQFSSPINKRGADLEMFSLKAEIALKGPLPSKRAGAAQSGRKSGGGK
jgi:Tfp pilus assembly protein PilN